MLRFALSYDSQKITVQLPSLWSKGKKAQMQAGFNFKNFSRCGRVSPGTAPSHHSHSPTFPEASALEEYQMVHRTEAADSLEQGWPRHD